ADARRSCPKGTRNMRKRTIRRSRLKVADWVRTAPYEILKTSRRDEILKTSRRGTTYFRHDPRYRSCVALILKPPLPLRVAQGTRSVFLAGSIEMGGASPWQAVIEAALADAPVTIWNPRRDDWDATWRQSIDDPRFHEQVTWELVAQER